MKRKKIRPDVIEFRVVVKKDKDPELFEKMNKFREVSWTAVAISGIVTYINKRNREK